MSEPLDLYDRIHRKDLELYNCISLLEHNENLAIQYHICQRVLQYPIAELRFYAPQFLQLLITVDTQSVALEEMIKTLCSKDPHFALMSFWHLQALLQDLSAEPESIGFQTCKRLINELQYDYFNYSTNQMTSPSSIIGATGAAKAELGTKFQPNIAPSIILATSLMAGVTVPEVTNSISPLVKLQGKQIKAMVFEVLKDVQRNLTENLTKKNTLNNASLNDSKGLKKITEADSKRARSTTLKRRVSSPNPPTDKAESPTTRKSDDLKSRTDNTSYAILQKKSRVSALGKLTKTHSSSALNNPKLSHLNQRNPDFAHSLPDLHMSLPSDSKDNLALHLDLSTGYSSDASARNSTDMRDSFDESGDPQTTSPPSTKSSQHVNLTKGQQEKLLKSNYFKNETQFVIALQNISIRLSKVPKEARLSTLKAELSVLNSDLPCEIDIPMLLPKSKKDHLHKICRIAVNESAVLNSAERVPYLLLIEYLGDSVDFNPLLSHNKKILLNIEESGDFGTSKKNKYKFDLAYKSSKHRSTTLPSEEIKTIDRPDNADNEVIESDLADVSVVKLTNKLSNSSLENSVSPSSSSNNIRDSDFITGQLRIASIMLQQLQSSNSPIPADQAAGLKQRIIESMNIKQKELSQPTPHEITEPAGERKLMNDMKVAGISYLGEDWQTKKERIRKESPYGHLDNWNLFSMIAKTGDDLAQEAFACQLIQLMANIWYQDNVKVWVKKMKILVTSISTGLVETITNAVSVHSIKKALEQHMIDEGNVPVGITLKDHFKLLFGEESSEKYQRAQENFAKSLSAYSVICYILQIKDRHNGNIMFDSEGHIVHIDFGFLLSNSPGSIGFEAAPFKLTQEYVDILGGTDSYYFKYFVELTKSAFKSLRNHADVIVDMVSLMQKDSSLPCFLLGANTSIKLKQRFELSMSDEEVENFIEVLISKSLNSAYTKLYDQFQLMTQGIYI